MLSALIGLALILLIAVVTVALGAATRLLAARIVGPRSRSDALLTPLERIALGNEIIARDLQPDDTHPIARTSARDAGMSWVDVGRVDGPVQRQDLAVRYPEVAAHMLR